MPINLNFLKIPFTNIMWLSRMELVERYLRRNMKRLDEMQVLNSRLSAGEADALEDLRNHAHKLTGSAGMYGFRTASRMASALEELAVELQKGARPVNESVRKEIASLIDALNGELAQRRRANQQARGPWLIKPRHQLSVIAPTFLMTFFALALGGGALGVAQWAGLNVLADRAPEDADAFLSLLRMCWLGWGFAGVMILGWGIYWSWKVSFSIFGPLNRLERQVEVALEGRVAVSSLKVRQTDALYHIFDLINRLMKEKPQ